MEEKYQVLARRDIQDLLQTSSSGLKLLISRYVAAFQGKRFVCWSTSALTLYTRAEHGCLSCRCTVFMVECSLQREFTLRRRRFWGRSVDVYLGLLETETEL